MSVIKEKKSSKVVTIKGKDGKKHKVLEGSWRHIELTSPISFTMPPHQKSHLDENEYVMYRGIPYKEAQFDRLAEELIQWLQEKPDALLFEEFLIKKGLTYSKAQKGMFLSKKFEEAVTFARMVLGTRREIGMLKDKLNTRGSMFVLPFYLDSWREALKLRAKYKADIEDNKNVTVVIEKVGEKNESNKRRRVLSSGGTNKKKV